MAVPEREDKMLGYLGLTTRPDSEEKNQGSLLGERGIGSTIWLGKGWVWGNSQWRKWWVQGRQRTQISNSEGWSGKVPESG